MLFTEGIAVAIATSSYGFFTFAVNQVAPLIVGSPLRLYGYFYIVAGFNLFGFFFILFNLPETKVSQQHNLIITRVSPRKTG